MRLRDDPPPTTPMALTLKAMASRARKTRIARNAGGAEP
jgi:hypothetical protein